MSYFNINLIADTNDITTVATGEAKLLLDSISAFLVTLYEHETELEDIGVNSEFELADEIIDQLRMSTNSINILKNRLLQINWQPLT